MTMITMILTCLCLLLMLLGDAEAIHDDNKNCPLGFVRHDRSCYLFSRIKANFAEASRLCHHFNSYLAKITSKVEDDFIRHYALTRGRALTYWLGASDLRRERTWTWEDPVRWFTYSNWAPGQPDNNGGIEHCLEIRKPFGNYLWNDYQCQVPGHFICETLSK